MTEVTFFILLSLYTPKRGYAIMQFIENETKGRFTIGSRDMTEGLQFIYSNK